MMFLLFENSKKLRFEIFLNFDFCNLFFLANFQVVLQVKKE